MKQLPSQQLLQTVGRADRPSRTPGRGLLADRQAQAPTAKAPRAPMPMPSRAAAMVAAGRCPASQPSRPPLAQVTDCKSLRAHTAVQRLCSSQSVAHTSGARSTRRTGSARAAGLSDCSARVALAIVSCALPGALAMPSAPVSSRPGVPGGPAAHRAKRRRTAAAPAAQSEHRQVTLLDYGAGNVRSVRNALRRLGYEVKDVRPQIRADLAPPAQGRGAESPSVERRCPLWPTSSTQASSSSPAWEPSRRPWVGSTPWATRRL